MPSRLSSIAIRWSSWLAAGTISLSIEPMRPSRTFCRSASGTWSPLPMT